MSIENHPNLHAVQLVTDTLMSLKASIRGKAEQEVVFSEEMKELVLRFVDDVEAIVDKSIK